MARQSERLISLGYYDEEEKPRVSYKENLIKIFHRKRRFQFGSPGTQSAMDDTGDQTLPSATLSSLSDLQWVTLSDISHTSIGDGWKALMPLDQSTGPLDQSTRPTSVKGEAEDQLALDTTKATVAFGNDQQILKKKYTKILFIIAVLLRCVSMCILAILLCFVIFLNGGSYLHQIQAFYSTHWESGSSESESIKLLQADLKQLQEELIRLRSKLLPKGLSMPNFALESQGARVLHAYPSQNYRSPSQPPLVMFLGIPILYPLHSSRTVIQGHAESLAPGRCWSFAGHQGQLFISLSQPVAVSHVTLGHISGEHAPYVFMHSTPHHFSVSGYLTEDGEGTHLGSFEYDPEGESFQTFELPCPTQTYRYVMLEILSNWGHPEYTCVYSFKVHGKIKQYS